MSAGQNLRASVEEYLAFDLVNEGRHEFLNEVQTRGEGGAWSLHEATHGSIRIEPLELDLELEPLYEAWEG